MAYFGSSCGCVAQSVRALNGNSKVASSMPTLGLTLFSFFLTGRT